jgi:hypothetical protein
MAREKLVKSKAQQSLDDLNDYVEYLLIDKYNLDIGLVEQASVYHKIGDRLADAMSYRDQARAELDRTKAECDKFIRQDAALANERITEAQVAAKIVEEATFQTANSEYLEWKLIADKWTVMKDSFNQRAYALRDLCQLWMANYYSDTAIAEAKSVASDRIAATARAAEAKARIHKRLSEMERSQ